jgi:hypothetical protein
MMNKQVINLCPSRKYYYTQLNNEDDPINSCFITTVVAGFDLINKDTSRFLEYAKRINLNRTQPEDILRHYITTSETLNKFYKRSHPNTTIPITEWADCVVYGFNTFLTEELGFKKKQYVYFDGSIFIETLIRDLKNGLPIAVSFKYVERKIPGHYSLVVGGEFINNQLLNLIVNDPYKNFLNNTSDGFQVKFSKTDWAKHSKGYGVRFNHI